MKLAIALLSATLSTVGVEDPKPFFLQERT
jgi:hypothetical protein